MLHHLLLSALLVGLCSATACRRNRTPVSTTPASGESTAALQSAPPPEARPAAAPTPAAPNAPARPTSAPGVDVVTDQIPTAPPNSSKIAPVDRTLTEALQRYNEANGKMPTDFSVLVAQKYLKTLPSPPAGKRFALDRPHMQVVVID